MINSRNLIYTNILDLTYFATFLFCIQLEFSHISITSVILNKNNYLVTSTESRFIMSFTLVK